MQENQNKQHQQQFTQSELQQLKAILSNKIETLENYAMLTYSDAVFYKEKGKKVYKDACFAEVVSIRNKAKKLAKLQKKVKNLISGKESF